MQDEYLLKNGSSKVRTHISRKAAMLVVFNFSSARKGEEVTAARDLRCQLIDILVNVAPTTSELLQPGEQVNEDSSAHPCLLPSAPQMEPTTPITSTIPKRTPPAPQLETDTPVNSANQLNKLCSCQLPL